MGLIRVAMIAAALLAPCTAVAVEGDWGAIHGTVDMSYDYDDVDAAPPAFHVFDVHQNTFSLHQINLSLTRSFPEGVSATFNGIFGDDAAVISPNGDDFDLTQGFFTYTVDKTSIIGGRFTTLAGIEKIDPASNFNASRGLLFSLHPLVHTGVRVTYKATEAVGLTLGINNGSITSKTDTNEHRTVEAQVSWWPQKHTGASLTYYTGDENPSTALGVQEKDLINLVASYEIGTLVLALDASHISIDNGPAGKIDQTGAALYANYRFGKSRIAPRFERLELDTGDPADPEFWANEWTLTLGYRPAPNLEFMFEMRVDQFDMPGDDDQQTATVKAVFQF
jgi:hypothetical protein